MKFVWVDGTDYTHNFTNMDEADEETALNEYTQRCVVTRIQGKYYSRVNIEKWSRFINVLIWTVAMKYLLIWNVFFEYII